MIPTRKSLLTTVILIASAFYFFTALASGTAELPNAKSILSKIQQKTRNFNDMSSSVEMRTVEANGKVSVREIDFKVLQAPNGEWVKSLLVFQKPKREKGVALLSHAYKGEKNRQWLYFPSARRVKSIAGKKSSGAFMGSEFRYTDLLPKPLEDFTHETLKKADVNGRSHWVIRRIAKDASSNQGYQHIWVEIESETIQQIEFFDKEDKLTKTLSAQQFETVDDVQRPKLLVMTNHLNGRSTELLTLSLTINDSLLEEDFSESVLDFSR